MNILFSFVAFALRVPKVHAESIVDCILRNALSAQILPMVHLKVAYWLFCCDSVEPHADRSYCGSSLKNSRITSGRETLRFGRRRGWPFAVGWSNAFG
jgi:hypothetical protein